jgi:hypothetical protein
LGKFLAPIQSYCVYLGKEFEKNPFLARTYGLDRRNNSNIFCMKKCVYLEGGVDTLEHHGEAELATLAGKLNGLMYESVYVSEYACV